MNEKYTQTLKIRGELNLVIKPITTSNRKGNGLKNHPG